MLPSVPTARLYLRPFTAADRPAFADLNADERVREFLPGVMTREQSDAMADRIEAHYARHGFGLWAVEVTGVAPFIGYVGLSVPQFHAHFTPCVEIGWRLDAAHWGNGYATEGAQAALAYGFTQLALPEIVSFTVPANRRSLGVMRRLGMTRDPRDDFHHPAFPPDHRLSHHVLCRITRADWDRRKRGGEIT